MFIATMCCIRVYGYVYYARIGYVIINDSVVWYDMDGVFELSFFIRSVFLRTQPFCCVLFFFSLYISSSNATRPVRIY